MSYKLEKLINELDAIQDDSYYNVSKVRIVIKINTVRFSKGVKNLEFRKNNPYSVEIWGLKKSVYYDKRTDKMEKDFCITTATKPTMEEAIELALNRYKIAKGDYSNKDYAFILYERAVGSGYEGEFEQWLKDVEEYNEDKKQGKHIIEKPVYDDDGIQIMPGKYKIYPRGINRNQDKRNPIPKNEH